MADLILLPKKATPEMCVAGVKVMAAAMGENEPQTAVIYGQPNKIYEAMVKAYKPNDDD